MTPLFTNNRKLRCENLRQYAQELGLDMKRLEADFVDLRNKSVIDADKVEALSLKATGTPAFFVNGRYLSGQNRLKRSANVIKPSSLD